MEFAPQKLLKMIDENKKNTNMYLKILESYVNMSIYYQSAIDEIETKLKIIDRELSYHETIGRANMLHQVQSRVKSFESILKKVERKNLMYSPEIVEKELLDIAGIRIICSYIDDIYLILNSLSQQSDITILEVEDYIKEPKESGYRSLHAILEIPVFFFKETRKLKVEIQFRTIAMDFWASLEHGLRYKMTTTEPELAKRLISSALTIATMEEEMLAIRNEIEQQKLNASNNR